MDYSRKAVINGLILVLIAPQLTPAAEQDKGPLQCRLKMALASGQSVPSGGGVVPVELTFLNRSEKDQQLTNSEYRMAVLNKDGEQLEDALTFTLEMRPIALKGRSTVDKPGVFVKKGKLEAGQDYYLVVSVRNLIGHVKFTAK